MAVNMINVVSDLYNSKAKKRALFRDLKIYMNDKAAYKDHRQNILSVYLEALKDDLVKLNLKYKGSQKDGMMEEFMEISQYIEALKYLMAFEESLYKYLEKQEDKEEDNDSKERFNPYS